MHLPVPLEFQIPMEKEHPYIIVARPKDLIFQNIMHLSYEKWLEQVIYNPSIAVLERGHLILIFKLLENNIYRFLQKTNRKRLLTSFILASTR